MRGLCTNLTFSWSVYDLLLLPDAAEDGAHGDEAEPKAQQQRDDGQDVRLLLGVDHDLVLALPA